MARWFGGLFNRDREITQVSPITEIVIPRKTWYHMLVWMPFTGFLVWCLGWSVWLYDCTRKGYRFPRWWRREFMPWWSGGGYVLVVASCVILGWLIATAASSLRMLFEQVLKQWDITTILRVILTRGRWGPEQEGGERSER